MTLCMGCMNEIDDQETKCPVCGFLEEKQTESPFLSPGTILEGKYIVGRALRYHGYTVTYIGMDAERSCKVWIHEYLPIDFSTRSYGENRVTIYSGDALARFGEGLVFFLNEAAGLERFGKLPGVAEVYACIAENDTGYVITEYLEGQTLKEQLEEGAHFSVEVAADHIKNLLSGLSVLHEHGILHSNIAPDTIFMTTEGEARLIDFGTARYVTSENTKNLSALYKKGYTPEEQYRRIGERNPSSDVYALAAVMYRMITGRVPEESVDRALKDELKAPSELGVEIFSASVENALMNALNVHQEDRTENAGKFLQELTAFDTKKRLVKQETEKEKKRWPWALAAGAFVVMLGLLAFFFVRFFGSKESIDQAATVDTSAKMPDLTRFASVEEAEEAARKKGILLKADIIFNQEEAGERIADQTVSAGIALNTVDAGLGKDGRVEVGCTVLTSKRAKYEVVKDWVASQYLFDEERKKEILVLEVKEEPKSKPFGAVYEIELKDGKKIKAEELFLEENGEKILKFDDIKNIWQYTGDIYWIKSMKNYVGKYVQDVSFQVNTYSSDGRKTVREHNSKEKLPVMEEFYSLSEHYGSGYIVSQMLEKGKKYRSDKMPGALFKVVKESVSYKKSDAKDLLTKLNKVQGVKVVEKGAGEMVRDIKIRHKKALAVKAKDYLFKTGDTIIVTLEPAPTPSPTPVPTRKAVSKPKVTPKTTPKPTPGRTPKPTPGKTPKPTPGLREDEFEGSPGKKGR